MSIGPAWVGVKMTSCVARTKPLFSLHSASLDPRAEDCRARDAETENMGVKIGAARRRSVFEEMSTSLNAQLLSGLSNTFCSLLVHRRRSRMVAHPSQAFSILGVKPCFIRRTRRSLGVSPSLSSLAQNSRSLSRTWELLSASPTSSGARTRSRRTLPPLS